MNGFASAWCDRRVLVTGCTSFLGKIVCRELLNRQAHVVGLVRDKNSAAIFAPEYASGQFHIVHGRAEDTARIHTTLAIHEIAAIFHLADDPTGPRWANTHRFIDAATSSLFRAASLRDHRLPVIVARPAAELRLVGSQTTVAIARFGEIFGPGDASYSRVIPRTISRLMTGESILETGSSPHDFVFVRDAARACLAVAEESLKDSEPLDVTFRSGWEMTDAEMARLIAEIWSGHRPQLSPSAFPAGPMGWQPGSSLPDVLAETIDWYRHNAAPASSGDSLRKAA